LLFAALVVVLALTKRGLFDFRSPAGFLRRFRRCDVAEDIGGAA
jgi:thiol:disulfide interchange protein